MYRWFMGRFAGVPALETKVGDYFRRVVMRINTHSRLSVAFVVLALLVSLGFGLIAGPSAAVAGRSSVAPAAVSSSCTITIHKETAQNDAVQRAINAFGPASTQSSPVTICLGPNTFPEQLTITGTVDLTILGSGNTSTFLAPTSVTSNGYNLDSLSSPVDAIIGAWNNTNLVISGVDVNGSAAASGLYNNCGFAYLGVYFGNTSGALNASTVSGINTNGGCQGQNAVYANTGFFSSGKVYPTSVAITNNTVSGFGKDGVVCKGVGLDCTVIGN